MLFTFSIALCATSPVLKSTNPYFFEPFSSEMILQKRMLLKAEDVSEIALAILPAISGYIHWIRRNKHSPSNCLCSWGSAVVSMRVVRGSYQCTTTASWTCAWAWIGGNIDYMPALIADGAWGLKWLYLLLNLGLMWF